MGKERSVSPVKDGPGTKQVQRPLICTCVCEYEDGYMRMGGKVRYQGMVVFKQRGFPVLGGGSGTGLMGSQMVMVCRVVGKSKEMTYWAKEASEHKEVALDLQTYIDCGYRDPDAWEEGKWDVSGRSNLHSNGGLQTERTHR